jgi:hypothetical protein
MFQAQHRRWNLANAPVIPRWRSRRMCDSVIELEAFDGRAEGSMPCCQAPRIPDILTVELTPSNDNYPPANQSTMIHEEVGYGDFIRDYREIRYGTYRRLLRAFVAVLIIAALYAELGIPVAQGALI